MATHAPADRGGFAFDPCFRLDSDVHRKCHRPARMGRDDSAPWTPCRSARCESARGTGCSRGRIDWTLPCIGCV